MKNTSLKHYFLVFSGAYILALILFGILSIAINITSASGVPTLIVGGFFTAWYFVKREKRIPDDNEKIQLVWGSIACTFFVSAILLFVYALLSGTTLQLVETLQTVPMWIWLFAIGFMILIEFIIFSLSYGWYAKKCLDGLNKKHLN